jgi:diaminopimelate epimerase
MNLFEGARRLVKLAAGAGVLAYAIAAYNQEGWATVTYQVDNPGGVLLKKSNRDCKQGEVHDFGYYKAITSGKWS